MRHEIAGFDPADRCVPGDDSWHERGRRVRGRLGARADSAWSRGSCSLALGVAGVRGDGRAGRPPDKAVVVARRRARRALLRGPTRSSNSPSTASSADARRHDLTARATFASSDPAVADRRRLGDDRRPGRRLGDRHGPGRLARGDRPGRGQGLRRRACRSTSPTRSCRSSPSSAATAAAVTARRAARTGSGSACWASSRPSITRRWSRKGAAAGSSPPPPSGACC